jgi:hypothetical protein
VRRLSDENNMKKDKIMAESNKFKESKAETIEYSKGLRG